MEYVELVALGDLTQMNHLLGDERDSLFRPALIRFLAPRSPSSGRGGARPLPCWFFHQTPSESLPGTGLYATPFHNSKEVFYNFSDMKLCSFSA